MGRTLAVVDVLEMHPYLFLWLPLLGNSSHYVIDCSFVNSKIDLLHSDFVEVKRSVLVN